MDTGNTVLGFSTILDKHYKQALDAGAMPVTPPQPKPWGQVVAYVRDINGVPVEICSPMEG